MRYDIVGHSADPDGIISHALLRRILSSENSSNQWDHHFVDYPNFLNTLEQLTKLENKESGELIIADISLNENFKDAILFSNLEKKYRSITWIDHHEGSMTGRSFLRQFCSSIIVATNKCAASLIQETYLPQDSYAEFLADIAQAHDYEKRNSFSEKGNQLQEIIASQFHLEKLVEDLTLGAAWNEGELSNKYTTISQQFRQRKQQALVSLEQSVERHNFFGKETLFAYADPLLYMKEAPEHLKRTQLLDYVFVFFEGISNVVLFGKGNIGTSAVDFCKLMQGGGRGHGGGFDIGYTITPENYLSAKKFVVQKFSDYLYSL